MADLVVIVPSRGRPEAAADLAEAFRETCTADTRLVFVVDADDPAVSRYYPDPVRLDGLASLRRASDAISHGEVAMPAQSQGQPTFVVVAENQPGTMVAALNEAAVASAVQGQWFAVGFMGDDHRPRTHGWDKLYLEALRELRTGIVYGNDLLQGENLPTQCAMTADIIRTLGYMAPPTLRHMYVDNYWRDLGRIARCLRYLPDVVVEHMHPLAGKADWDAGHLRVNDAAVYDADADAYRAHPLLADATKVLALRRVAS